VTAGILHVVPAMFDATSGILGGAERYAFELARTMARLAPTRLLAFGERDERHRDGELDVIVARAHHVRGQRSNPWSSELLRWILHSRVVHCHQRAVLASSTSALLARLLRRPVFATDLGGGGWDVSAYLDASRWFTGHLHISSYSVHVNGHDARRDAHVIGGGVDATKFAPDASVPRDGSVLFVGRIMPHKGLDYLVQAIEHEKLRVIGMPYDGRFFEDVKTLARGKDVEFIHGATDEVLVRAYRSASVLVLPSVYRTRYGETTLVPELLGQTPLEAMACGTPAICTNVASLPEVVADGETGFLVPPNDPAALRARIRWLLERPAEVVRMGEAGRRRVLEHFDWEAVARRCLAIYRSAS
jgi:glycosyltransferase involved in cell wall biosynthesis